MSALRFHPAFLSSRLFDGLPFADLLPSLTLEVDSIAEGVDTVGEQGAVRRRGAPLAGTADSSPVETPSGSPTTSCGRV